MHPLDVVAPHANDIIGALISVIGNDNEDNAVIGLKTVMEIMRSQGKNVEGKVQDFMDLIQKIFAGMDQVVTDTFDVPAAAPVNAAQATPNSKETFSSPRPSSPASTSTSVTSGSIDIAIDQPQAPKTLSKGMASFKVLAECPIIVVSLFQAHKPAVTANVKQFIPLIKGILMATAKPQAAEHDEAMERGEVFTGVSRNIKNRAAFGEFVTAQVKTMSFLAYLLRVWANQLHDFLPVLPNICIRMLRDCPSEKSAARKELLVAIRHIINFNFREIFTDHLDDLLDERTLIGDGLTVYETMRPLAYSMLADLIHHIRTQLKPHQMRRTIELFSKNMLDDFPGTSFQTMSAKLLLNLADPISGLSEKDDGRYFLVMILDAIADKFELMNKEYPNAVKLSKQQAPESAAISALPENHLADPDNPPDWDETDIFFATPIKTSIPRDPTVNPVDDNKFLFKNLMQGLKNMFFRLKMTNPPDIKLDESQGLPTNWQEISVGYKAEEVTVITRLFREGAKVFRYYSLDQPAPENNLRLSRRVPRQCLHAAIVERGERAPRNICDCLPLHRSCYVSRSFPV